MWLEPWDGDQGISRGRWAKLEGRAVIVNETRAVAGSDHAGAGRKKGRGGHGGGEKEWFWLQWSPWICCGGGLWV